MSKLNLGIVIVTMTLLIGCGVQNVSVDPDTPSPTVTNVAVSPVIFSSPVPTTQNVEILSVSAPQSGKGSVTGQVISSLADEPIANIVVRLAEVYRQNGQGAYVLDDAFSPGAITNDYGFFVIENIEPKEYVIVVGDVNIEYTIIKEDDGTAHAWVVEPDQILDLGSLDVMLSK